MRPMPTSCTNVQDQEHGAPSPLRVGGGHDVPPGPLVVPAQDPANRLVVVAAVHEFAGEPRKRRDVGQASCRPNEPVEIRAQCRVLGSNRRGDVVYVIDDPSPVVSDAMARMYTYKKVVRYGEPSWRQIWLEDELADVSSWLFALVEKLDLIRRTADAYDWLRFGEPTSRREPIRLSSIIWRRYGSDATRKLFCPHCESQTECQCSIVLVDSPDSRHKIMAKVADVLDF